MRHNLNSIVVKGFKSIMDQKIDLNNLNVLIGQNGAGKSNFVQLFTFLRNIYNGELQNITSKWGGANALLFKGRKVTEIIGFEFDFHPNYYKLELEVTDENGFYVREEWAGYQNSNYPQPIYKKIVGRQNNESNLRNETGGIGLYIRDIILMWHVYHFHDTSPSARVKQTIDLDDNVRLATDAGNLAAFLYWLKRDRNQHYLRIVDNIKLALPFFNDFVLIPEGANGDNIRLRWSEIDSEQIYSAAALSDGSLRFICLTTLLLQPHHPKLIIIDEPELGLHPAAIVLLAGLLRKASHTVQVIVSTQSPGLVNEFEPENILVVDKSDADGSVFRRLSTAELSDWLNDYTLGDLWDKNVFGGRP